MSDRYLSLHEQNFFGKVFRQWKDSKIEFILLRNYSGFPKTIGNDLDVFFCRAHVNRAFKIFTKLLLIEGGKILHIHQRDYFIAVWFSMDGTLPNALHVDFYHGAFTWHGLPYLDEDVLLASQVDSGIFNVPRPAHEALSLHFASLLWGGFFKETYRNRIAALLTNKAEFDIFKDCYKSAFGIGYSQDTLSLPATQLRAYANRLRFLLKKRRAFLHPFMSLMQTIRYWCGEAKTILNPPGCYVAVFLPVDSSESFRLLEEFKKLAGKLFGESRTINLSDDSGIKIKSPFLLFQLWITIKKLRAKNHLIITVHNAFDHQPLIRWLPRPDATFLLSPDIIQADASRESQQRLKIKEFKIKHDSTNKNVIENMILEILNLLYKRVTRKTPSIAQSKI